MRHYGEAGRRFVDFSHQFDELALSFVTRPS
jgi:hypothetical protein